MAPTDPPPRGTHETSDVSIGGIVKFGIGLAAAAILVHVAIFGYFRALEAHDRKESEPVSPLVAASLRRTPPEPRLEPNPLAPRLRMRATEDAVLTTYGWVDRKAGVARIPIARAMDLLIERGLPVTKPVTPVPAPAQTGGNRKPEIANQ